MPGGRNDRRAPRIEVRLPAKLFLLQGKSTGVAPALSPTMNRRFYGDIIDISMNGAFIACEPLPVMSRFLLAFPLPTYGTVKGVGLCTWGRATGDGTGRAGMGILFEHIPLAARIAIDSLARQIPEEPVAPVPDFEQFVSEQHGDACCSDPDCGCWQDPGRATQKVAPPSPDLLVG